METKKTGVDTKLSNVQENAGEEWTRANDNHTRGRIQQPSKPVIMEMEMGMGMEWNWDGDGE